MTSQSSLAPITSMSAVSRRITAPLCTPAIILSAGTSDSMSPPRLHWCAQRRTQGRRRRRNDLRRDQEQTLGRVALGDIAAKQPAQQRDAAQERDLRGRPGALTPIQPTQQQALPHIDDGL